MFFSDCLTFYSVGLLVTELITYFLIFCQVDKRKMFLVIFPFTPVFLWGEGRLGTVKLFFGFCQSGISSVNHPALYVSLCDVIFLSGVIFLSHLFKSSF